MAPNSFHRPFLPPEALSDGRTIAAAADEAIRIARGGDARRGLALALHARQQALGLDMEGGELAALNAAAIVHAIRGDHMAAVATGIDTYNLARRRGDGRIAVHALITMGTAAFALGALSEARTALEGCIRQSIELGDTDAEIRSRIGMGIALGDLGDFDGAAAQFVRSLVLIRLHGDTTSPARVTSNLANVHLKRGRRLTVEGDGVGAEREFLEAELLAKQALSLASDEGNMAVKIDALAIRGRARELQGDREGARSLLAESAAIAQAIRCRTKLPWVQCEAGRIALAMGDVSRARIAYTEALEAGVEWRPNAKIEEACLGLADVETQACDEASARRWRERAAVEGREYDHLRAQTRSQLEAFFAKPL